MTSLLMVEDLFLLTHNEESGKIDSGLLALDNVLAGALLLDLAEREVMDVADKNVVSVAGGPSGHALVDQAQQVIAQDKPRSIEHWVGALPRKLKPFQEKVGTSLVERGVLDHERAKVLGLFPSERWPERDPGPERELRAGLRAVLVQGVTPTDRQALLIPLLHAAGMIAKLVEKDERKQAKQAAKALSAAAKDGQLVSSAVAKSVQATEAAVMVAVMTPAIVATVTN